MNGDPTRLSQILQNLLVNAARYTPDGGRVGVKVTAEDGFVSISVSDTGRGIDAAELERIFGCPVEHLEFHLWYLKAKRWIEKLDNGMYGITIEGVDHVNAEHHRKSTTRLLMDQSDWDDDLP